MTFTLTKHFYKTILRKNTEIDKKMKSYCTKKTLLLQNFSFQMKREKSANVG